MIYVDQAPSGQGLGDGVWGVGKSPKETDTSLFVYEEEKINMEKDNAVREFLNSSLSQAPSLLGRSSLPPNKKRIHLFGKTDKYYKEMIVVHAKKIGVIVSFEEEK